MTISIKNVLLNGQITNIYIKGSKIESIGEFKDSGQVIDGSGKAALPSFYNGHTHAAMTLFRGYGDDMPLKEWLENKIWPMEAKLDEDDVYWGARMACLEMIRTGTTHFADMYWHLHGTARAVEDAGIRGLLNSAFIDVFSVTNEQQVNETVKLYEESSRYSDRIKFSLGAHAIYTVSTKSLKWIAEFSRENNIPVQIHLSETEKEVQDCIQAHGMRPVEYLEKIGFLSERVIAAHAVWLSDEEIKILAASNVKIVHNPISNLKLSVGKIMNLQAMAEAGLRVYLGTDGCSSNNNLDILEEAKFCALLQKHNTGDPTAAGAEQVFEMITGGSTIEEGSTADLILIDLNDTRMMPLHSLKSNMIYSAGGSVVDTTICDGKVLMENKIIPGEEKIKEEFLKHVKKRFYS